MKGTLLPRGNRGEFSKLDAELKRRGINAEINDIPGGGRVYRIPDDQLHLLPTDERGTYLGDDDSGHSIFDISDDWLAELTRPAH